MQNNIYYQSMLIIDVVTIASHVCWFKIHSASIKHIDVLKISIIIICNVNIILLNKIDIKMIIVIVF